MQDSSMVVMVYAPPILLLPSSSRHFSRFSATPCWTLEQKKREEGLRKSIRLSKDANKKDAMYLCFQLRARRAMALAGGAQ